MNMYAMYTFKQKRKDCVGEREDDGDDDDDDDDDVFAYDLFGHEDLVVSS